MDFNEGMDQLSKLCKGKDWFYDIGTDQYGRYVVYIKFSCHETLHDIPDYVGGRQVVVHFASSMLSNKDQFVSKLAVPAPIPVVVVTPEPVDVVDEVIGSSPDEQSLRHLQNELDRLEKACGSYTLQDIFYEAHDGKNAVTNMSARYPEVRNSMDKLLQQYGFDVIYEELDG